MSKAIAGQKLAEAQNTKTQVDFYRQNASNFNKVFSQSYHSASEEPTVSASRGAELVKIGEFLGSATETGDALTQALMDNFYVSEEGAEQLKNHSKELIANANTIKENTLTQQAAAKAIASQALGTNKDYQNADETVQNIVDNKVARILQNKEDPLYQEAESKVHSMSKEAKQDAYAQTMGYAKGADGQYYTSKEAADSKSESEKIK